MCGKPARVASNSYFIRARHGMLGAVLLFGAGAAVEAVGTLTIGVTEQALINTE